MNKDKKIKADDGSRELAIFLRIAIIALAVLFPPIYRPKLPKRGLGYADTYGSCRDFFDTFAFLFNLNTCKVDIIFWLILMGITIVVGHFIYKAILGSEK